MSVGSMSAEREGPAMRLTVRGIAPLDGRLPQIEASGPASNPFHRVTDATENRALVPLPSCASGAS